ncbi:MAG: PfkB family carbohydrate kinase [Magnetococcus sp. DMHC-8]
MPHQQKIVSLEELGQQARLYRQQGKRVVLCHGVFDLLHPGHVRHLQGALQFGDVLLVTITADPFVNKGPGRPIFPDVLRAESLAALACVGHVAINHGPTAVPIIHLIQPHAYVKGQDYKNAEQDVSGNISVEQHAVETYGGQLCYTEEIMFSSSGIINDHFEVFSPATKEYLRHFKSIYQADQIIGLVQSLQKSRVLVVGEAIVDEYCYVTQMGVVGKGVNVVASKYGSTEQFAGGALAVANHLAGFVEHVTLLTGLGHHDRNEPFIRAKLAANIQPIFHYFEQAPTVVKRRYVDGAMNKLFELYFYEEEALTAPVEEQMCRWIADHAGGFDLVVVPDYGNGLISQNMVQALCDHARYLAVNTQINGGNRGYHVITRYPRADFAAINEPELRLAAHNRFAPLDTLARKISATMQTKQFAVTQGSDGAVLLDNQTGLLHQVPVLSTRVVDRVGAGDSFLAFASLALSGGIPAELSLFLGSAAAALDVQIVCNRDPISPVPLFKYITTLLK